MKRHPTDSVSLVFGLLFAAVVGFWSLSAVTDSAPRLPAAWIGAIALLIIGVVGLVSSLRPQRARPADDETPALAGDHLDQAGYTYPLQDAHRLDPHLLDSETIAEEYRLAGFDDTPATADVATVPLPAPPSSAPPAPSAPASAPPAPSALAETPPEPSTLVEPAREPERGPGTPGAGSHRSTS